MIEESPSPGVAPPAFSPEAGTSGLIRIAVADDHPAFRDGLCEILSLEPDFCLIGKASNGEEILQIVKTHSPEILLLDLFMPGTDGWATLRLLRQHAPPTKVIILTASEDREHLVRAMQLGASGIVLKQDSTSVLIKSIRRVQAGEIWLHPSTTEAVMQRETPLPVAPPFPHEFAARPLPSVLTRKEMEVVRLIAQGLRNREIASRMRISEQTVKNHLRAIFEKLHVGDRLELALYAIHHIIGRTG
jgi:DNA-binding NarL/FixJ family response regulator